MALTARHPGADLRILVPGKFAWYCVPEQVAQREVPVLDGCTMVSTDATYVYEQFFADFGPLNLACVTKHCRRMFSLLEQGTTVVHYCGDHPHKRANAAFLACCVCVCVLKQTAEEAFAPFLGCDPPLHPFRDAGFGVCTFQCLVLDCVRGVAKACALKHYDYAQFDVDAYETLEKLEEGDLAWIVPGKFAAFSTPTEERRELRPGVFTLAVEQYAALFKRLNITCVVRFNKKLYDRAIFQKAGIRHVDLWYEDGSNPSEAILQRFLALCEQEAGGVAVHCKAGLGRTGTNIGAYMMKHFGYSARECIGWMRICRPGSVIGPQQQFLVEAEDRLWREGAVFRQQRANWPEQPLPSHKPPLYEPPAYLPSGSLVGVNRARAAAQVAARRAKANRRPTG